MKTLKIADNYRITGQNAPGMVERIRIDSRVEISESMLRVVDKIEGVSKIQYSGRYYFEIWVAELFSFNEVLTRLEIFCEKHLED